MPAAGDVQNHRMPRRIEVQIVNVNVHPLRLIIDDQRIILRRIQRRLEWLARCGSPRITEIRRLRVIQIRPLIDTSPPDAT
jgi:hypothetical protein